MSFFIFFLNKNKRRETIVYFKKIVLIFCINVRLCLVSVNPGLKLMKQYNVHHNKSNKFQQEKISLKKNCELDKNP